MELARVIAGPVVTEKSERLKAGSPKSEKHIYTFRVAPQATKIDVRNALKKFYDVEAESVRVIWVQPKSRLIATGSMEKRHRTKKAVVTLGKKSKALDFSSFRTS